MTTISFVILFSVVFSLNLFSCFVIDSVHKPKYQLYRYLTKSNLTVNQRIKIQSFIEKLCGPDIGFYCLDLFPMNNFEFYVYCVNCVKNYILFNQTFL